MYSGRYKHVWVFRIVGRPAGCWPATRHSPLGPERRRRGLKFTGLAQNFQAGSEVWLKIPMRGLTLAQTFGQPVSATLGAAGRGLRRDEGGGEPALHRRAWRRRVLAPPLPGLQRRPLRRAVRRAPRACPAVARAQARRAGGAGGIAANGALIHTSKHLPGGGSWRRHTPRRGTRASRRGPGPRPGTRRRPPPATPTSSSACSR